MNHSNIKTLNQPEILAIAKNIASRWVLTNYGSFYNVFDSKTKENSISGGDRNFASYNMDVRIKSLYLKKIGENNSYFDWQINGVQNSNDRKSYLIYLKYEIVENLCGFQTIKNTQTI